MCPRSMTLCTYPPPRPSSPPPPGTLPHQLQMHSPFSRPQYLPSLILFSLSKNACQHGPVNRKTLMAYLCLTVYNDIGLCAFMVIHCTKAVLAVCELGTTCITKSSADKKGKDKFWCVLPGTIVGCLCTHKQPPMGQTACPSFTFLLGSSPALLTVKQRTVLKLKHQ